MRAPKALAVATLSPFPLIAIDDLATMDLDEAAMARKYQRPSLIDFSPARKVACMPGSRFNNAPR